MNKTISAADIVFPDDEPNLPPMAPAVTVAGIDMDAVLHDIWRSLGEGGALNRNEQLVAAIRKLIETGVDTKPRIVGAAMRLGFNRGHAGAVLSKSEGSDPERHRWQRGNDGVFRLHTAAAVRALHEVRPAPSPLDGAGAWISPPAARAAC